MKSRTLVCAATVAALGFAGVAQAQPSEHQWRGEAQAPHQQEQGRGQHAQNQRAQGQHQQYQQRQQWQAPAYQQHAYVAPQYNYQQQRGYNNYAPRYDGGQRAGYYVGGYAPANRYWVRDWRERHLYAPPNGYGWVQTDTGDVLLIALATGLIANAILAQ